jgi:aspartate/methionine/tyrosine aminotransferase
MFPLITGGMSVSMPAPEEDELKPNTEVVMSHITDRSRIMVVNSPNNLIGVVLAYDDLMSFG